MDGQIEKMQLHTLDTLLREDTWGRQVMIIQGYVPTVSIQTGNYSHAPQVYAPVCLSPHQLKPDRIVRFLTYVLVH